MIVDQQPHELKKADTVGTESSLESSGRGSTGNGSASSEFGDVEEGISIIANEEEDVIIPAAHHQRRMNTVILLSILPLAAALIALGILLSNNNQSTSISSAKVQPSKSNTNTNITESISTAQSPSDTEIIIIETMSNIENTQGKLPPNEPTESSIDEVPTAVSSLDEIPVSSEEASFDEPSYLDISLALESLKQNEEEGRDGIFNI